MACTCTLRVPYVFVLLFCAFCSLWTAPQAQSSTTEDPSNSGQLAAINSELGPMDYVWVGYCAIAFFVSLFCIIPCGYCYTRWCKASAFEAVSIETYTTILASRGYNADNKANFDDRSLAMLVLRSDLKDKRVWHHDWKQDFLVFIRNEHSLFSTCFAHESHPLSKKDRRCILTSMILVDFAIAVFLTYMLAFISTSNAAEFVLDYCISYIFGIIMTLIESLLVKFAVCSCVEKCPTCCRKCVKCCGSLLIVNSVIWSAIAFIISIVFIGVISAEQNSQIFWSVFAFSYFVGLFQAWFLIDFIFMGIEFRDEWKYAHPLSPEEKQAQREKEATVSYKCLRVVFWVFCFWAIFLRCCCCKPPEDDREDGDDGQDEFGINYHEFMAFNEGKDVGQRQLPQSYQLLSVSEFKDNAKKKVVQSVTQTKDQLKERQTQLTDGAKETITKTKDKVNATKASMANKTNSLKSKWNTHIKISKKKSAEVTPAPESGGGTELTVVTSTK